MTGISWMLQEAGDCPGEDYVVYDDHEEEEEGSGDSMEYEYTYDAQSDKEQNVTDSNSKQHNSCLVTLHVTVYFWELITRC